MILYKFFAIAFLILTPIFAFIIHRFFSLKYLGLNFADLTFPLYFIEVVAVSARFFTHSFLPYITILLSLAAIIITIQMLRKTQPILRRILLPTPRLIQKPSQLTGASLRNPWQFLNFRLLSWQSLQATDLLMRRWRRLSQTTSGMTLLWTGWRVLDKIT